MRSNKRRIWLPGFQDIVIILERPRPRKYHEFDVNFEEFVKECPTLRAVDELISFATRGARSIHTTTILNAFSYNKKVTRQDQECHAALARILKAKKPKVILRCHRDDYKDEWLKCIEQPGVGYRLERKEINIPESRKTVVLQSFHPSCAVNNADCRPEYRALLMYHFVAAFSELRSEVKLPKTAKNLEKLCILPGERRPRDVPNYEQWQAAIRISEMLEEKYEGPCKKKIVGLGDETPHENRRKQIEAFEAMYSSLDQLFGESKEPGGLAISKIVLFLWKKHFQTHTLYQHITSWLILRGNEQKDWLPCDTSLSSNARPLEEQVSELQISKSPNFYDIQALNIEARLSANQASETIIRGDSIENKLQSQMVKTLKEHNTLIREYLSRPTMSDISNTMHITSLLSHCDIFLSALTNNDVLEQGDLTRLVQCLHQLASFFNAKNVLYVGRSPWLRTLRKHSSPHSIEHSPQDSRDTAIGAIILASASFLI